MQGSEIFQQAIDRLLIYCLEWDKFDMTDTGISPRPRRWDFVMAVSLVAGIMWTVGAPLSSSPSAREGFFAPDFTLDTLQGEQVKLSGLRGKVIVLNFWTTWCPPCRAETPALEMSYEAYKDLDVVILGVNLTDQDSLKKWSLSSRNSD